MGQDFIDDGVGHGQVIARFRSGSGEKTYDIGRAIGQASLRNAVQLQTEIHRIDQREVGVAKAERLSKGIKAEADVVATLGKMTIRLPQDKAVPANKTQRTSHEIGLPIHGWIISKVDAAE